jgi:hypothetical protein
LLFPLERAARRQLGNDVSGVPRSRGETRANHILHMSKYIHKVNVIFFQPLHIVYLTSSVKESSCPVEFSSGLVILDCVVAGSTDIENDVLAEGVLVMLAVAAF